MDEEKSFVKDGEGKRVTATQGKVYKRQYQIETLLSFVYYCRLYSDSHQERLHLNMMGWITTERAKGWKSGNKIKHCNLKDDCGV